MDANSVIRAIPEEETLPKNQFRTSNGVLLKLKPVPPLLIADAQRRLVEPKPPKARNLDKGDDVYEENPNDPDYIRQLEEHNQIVGDVSSAILITRGTEVIERPHDIDSVDATDWADDVKEIAGIDVPSMGRRRYFCWMKYVVLVSADDFHQLIQRLSRLAGVTREEDVAQAADRFRNNSQGDTPTGVRAIEADGRGNPDSISFSGTRTGV